MGGWEMTYIMEPALAPIPADRDPGGTDKVCAWCDHRYICPLLDAGAVPYEALREKDAEIRG